jgi:hypothetical protein
MDYFVPDEVYTTELCRRKCHQLTIYDKVDWRINTNNYAVNNYQQTYFFFTLVKDFNTYKEPITNPIIINNLIIINSPTIINYQMVINSQIVIKINLDSLHNQLMLLNMDNIMITKLNLFITLNQLILLQTNILIKTIIKT